MRALCLWTVSALLLAGCGQSGGAIAAPGSVGSEAGLMAPIGVATTFYVDGVNGNDSNDCKSPQTACKTIQHAVSISGPGDTIDVAAGVYPENVTIHHGLQI